MNQYFPKLCPPTCGLEINFRRIKQNPRIKVFTQAEVKAIEGEPGAYRVTVELKPRRVNDSCTACDECVAACPVERSDAFNYGMGTTKAIYLPHAMAYPPRYVIDPQACLGESCAKCVAYCPYDAIELDRAAAGRMELKRRRRWWWPRAGSPTTPRGWRTWASAGCPTW